MLKVLTFSTLYPNDQRPRHGVFVEQRLRHLLAGGAVQSRVVAPVPWFPWRHPRFGSYAEYARVSRAERRHDIEVLHPRYPLIPKFGMSLAPWLMARALRAPLRRLLAGDFAFDLIDAHYFYPDGVAAVLLGAWLGKPVVVTARGSDLNVLPNYYGPRRQIRWAAGRAAHMITVCQALKDRLIELGAVGDRITVLRNGVDLTLFQPPADRPALRADLGMRGPTLLSVGNLLPLKGHHLVIEALTRLPDDVSLRIAGGGPEEGRLRALVERLGLQQRVQLLGVLDHAELVRYYGAADALVLASSREGWANVLLEAMACGTPVVATAVSGTPEVVTQPAAGVLVEERSAAGIAAGVQRLWANPPARAATRAYAEAHDWGATSRGQMEVFERVLAQAEAAGAAVADDRSR